MLNIREMAFYMTKHPAHRSNITLPLFIDYVDVLLPSLTTQAGSLTIDQSCDTSELLWVVQDKEAHLTLKTQLKNHKIHKTHNTPAEETQILQIATLSELSQQQVPKRYELVCFWLPTLSLELLQQYIPLLMRYRDLYAAHLLIALDDTMDLKAYGFTPFDILNKQSLETDHLNIAELPFSITASSISAKLWQFNLYDYKQLPNWFNTDYWANPENWGKHRW